MPDLSPAAQAVLDAVEDDCIHPTDLHRLAAAALRAATDQVVPKDYISDQSEILEGFDVGAEFRNREIHADFLALAAELEGLP